MISNSSANHTPWYRHPWPWILMAGPFIAVVAGTFTAYLAIVSNDGLVDDDYYARGMDINRTMARDKAALSLGVQADLMQSAQQSTQGPQLRVLLRAKPGTVVPQALQLRITHPTRPGVDQTLSLRADGAGSYSGTLKTRLAGRWHLALEDTEHTWRLSGDWIIESASVLHLPAGENTAGGTPVR